MMLFIEILAIFLEEQVIQYLIFLQIQNMMDINMDLFQ